MSHRNAAELRSTANNPSFHGVRAVAHDVLDNTLRAASRARASGAGHTRIRVRHVLPNVLGLVVVIATVNVSTLILAEPASIGTSTCAASPDRGS
jgi:hypothetical protein